MMTIDVQTMFATKFTKEKRIPFEVAVDPFYSLENIAEIERRIKDLESGKVTLTEHELIEVD